MFPVPRLVVLIVVDPLPIANSVVVFELPTMLQFLTVLFVAAFGPVAVCSHTTALDVTVLVFVIVRILDATEGGQTVFVPPEFDPSIVT